MAALCALIPSEIESNTSHSPAHTNSFQAHFAQSSLIKEFRIVAMTLGFSLESKCWDTLIALLFCFLDIIKQFAREKRFISEEKQFISKEKRFVEKGRRFIVKERRFCAKANMANILMAREVFCLEKLLIKVGRVMIEVGSGSKIEIISINLWLPFFFIKVLIKLFVLSKKLFKN